MVSRLITIMVHPHMRLLLSLMLHAAFASGAVAADKVSLKFTDIEGGEQKPFHMEGRKASVLLFTTVDCPVANAFAPEIKRICEAYTDKGVAFYLVHVDPDVTAEDARRHTGAYGYTCPVLLDARHQLVKAVGAKITPEAVVIDARGKQVYHGRINNTYEDYGVKRQEATKHELRDAIEDVLAGRKVRVAKAVAVGCYIPPQPK